MAKITRNQKSFACKNKAILTQLSLIDPILKNWLYSIAKKKHFKTVKNICFVGVAIAQETVKKKGTHTIIIQFEFDTKYEGHPTTTYLSYRVTFFTNSIYAKTNKS